MEPHEKNGKNKRVSLNSTGEAKMSKESSKKGNSSPSSSKGGDGGEETRLPGRKRRSRRGGQKGNSGGRILGRGSDPTFSTTEKKKK